MRNGLPVAALELRYADGTQAELPIIYGEHVRQEDAASDLKSECPQAVVAWTWREPGQPIVVGVVSPEKRAARIPLGWQTRLYLASFVNPQPQREVRQIEYVSKVTQAAPFLVALTVE